MEFYPLNNDTIDIKQYLECNNRCYQAVTECNDRCDIEDKFKVTDV